MFPGGILVMSGSAVPPPLKAFAFLWRMAYARCTGPCQVLCRHDNMRYTPGRAFEEV